nr:MAG TPA: hypothetical protein [Caudoviricetes sp.]
MAALIEYQDVAKSNARLSLSFHTKSKERFNVR